MQQGKARSQGKGAREKGAKAKEGRQSIGAGGLKLASMLKHRTAQKGTHRINV